LNLVAALQRREWNWSLLAECLGYGIVVWTLLKSPA